MLHSQISVFHEEINATLKKTVQAIPNENFEIYKKSALRNILFPLSASEHTRVNLPATFPAYMNDAKPFTNTKANEKVMFRIFQSSTCGHIAVFATTDSLNRSGLHFGVWKPDPKSTYQNECLFADHNQCKAHTLIVTGVPLRMCAYCSAILVISSYKCSRCKDRAGVHVRYCGIDCQHAHWHCHKSFCKKTK
jgi:hypothetical protein